MYNEILIYLGAIISLYTYRPLGKVVRKNPKSHSYMAFFIWAGVELSTGITVTDGSWLLMAAYALGSVYIGVILYNIDPNKSNDNGEKVIIILVIISFIIWAFLGKTAATITLSIVSIFAGMLEMKRL